jgi:hypothetical protein
MDEVNSAPRDSPNYSGHRPTTTTTTLGGRRSRTRATLSVTSICVAPASRLNGGVSPHPVRYPQDDPPKSGARLRSGDSRTLSVRALSSACRGTVIGRAPPSQSSRVAQRLARTSRGHDPPRASDRRSAGPRPRSTLRSNSPPHDPLTRSEPGCTLESCPLEHRSRPTPQEGARSRLALGVNRVSVDLPTPSGSDRAKRASQRGLRDSLPPPVAIDEEARNPPVGERYPHSAVCRHAARQLRRGSKLAPPDDFRPIINESRVGSMLSYKRLFFRPPPGGNLNMLTGSKVELEAPTAVPDPVVLFHDAHEIGPGGRPKLPH